MKTPRLIAAPLATITHRAFREVVKSFREPAEFRSEMIDAARLVSGGRFEKFYTDSLPSPEKLVFQIVGNNAETVEKATKILVKLPSIGVDFNMSCPAPEIRNSGGGVAWLGRSESEISEVVSRMRQVIDDYEKETRLKKRLSVKLRLWDGRYNHKTFEKGSFDSEKFFSIIETLISAGVEEITLHARTPKEKYKDPVHAEYTEELARKFRSKVRIIYNGDVKDALSLQKAERTCPKIDSFMIGRAMVSRPWIFLELSGEGAGKTVDLEETGLLMIRKVSELLPEEFHKTRLERFFAFYADNFTFAEYLKKKIMRCEKACEMESTFRSYFSEVPEDKFTRLSPPASENVPKITSDVYQDSSHQS